MLSGSLAIRAQSARVGFPRRSTAKRGKANSRPRRSVPRHVTRTICVPTPTFFYTSNTSTCYLRTKECGDWEASTHHLYHLYIRGIEPTPEPTIAPTDVPTHAPTNAPTP